MNIVGAIFRRDRKTGFNSIYFRAQYKSKRGGRTN